jgi:hypothetical protein
MRRRLCCLFFAAAFIEKPHAEQNSRSVSIAYLKIPAIGVCDSGRRAEIPVTSRLHLFGNRQTLRASRRDAVDSGASEGKEPSDDQE